MQRFHIPILEASDDSMTIKNPDLLNQFIKVMRIKPGTEVAFFNGIEDIDYIFEVKDVQKREVYLEKTGYIEVDSEIDFDLNLINALPNKLDKIEYILQKGTEIGITGFYFFSSQRSQKLALSENKITRLEKIIIEAAEQSGRSRIPELIIEESIELDYLKDNENIFFHTQDDNSIWLKDINPDYGKWINLFVGPEGWFSEEEIQTFTDNKFLRVHLGNRILRTETTGTVAWFMIIQWQ